MKHIRSTKLDIAKSMPALRHTIPEEDFDITNSEVVQWLIKQPDILQYLFDSVHGKEIVFNPKTGTWKGVDYGKE